MGENIYNDFDSNLKEIKELSEKLKQPLEESAITLYYDEEKTKIKYKGGYIDNKYEGHGLLYDKEGYIEYDGSFSNNKYNGFGKKFSNKTLKYEGFFTEGKKNGIGLLYYDKIKKIYFNGIFDMDNYSEGIEYDPEGAKLYQGSFINNKPKEGIKIKYYLSNGKLKYEGDFLDGKYHGYGTLYENGNYEQKGIFSEFKYLHYTGEFKNDRYNGQGKLYFDHFLGRYLFYEGNFDNNKLSGNGKMYYQNKKLFYEGIFGNNNINGKGIKYYKNGNIKFEGIFSNNICTQGIYYSPEGIKLYEGEFKNDIPIESKNIIIYDNNTNKIYEGEIHNGLYEGKGIEYCPLIKDKILFEGNFKNNEYILPNIDIKKPVDKELNQYSKIVLLSDGDNSGKTNLINRICGCEFVEAIISTVGFEKCSLSFDNNNLKHKLKFCDTGGTERFKPVALKNAKYANMAIYLFDLSRENKEISLDFINDIREQNENIKIYIVGNKLDLLNENQYMECINKEYYERFRSKAIEAMNKNLVEKYFEISVKTMEGVEKLMNSIKIDSLIYVKSLFEQKNISDNKEIKKIIKKNKENCVVF